MKKIVEIFKWVVAISLTILIINFIMDTQITAEKKKVKTWPYVEGFIYETWQAKSGVKCHVEYSVKGKTYNLLTTCKEHDLGSFIRVYYNAQKPDDAFEFDAFKNIPLGTEVISDRAIITRIRTSLLQGQKKSIHFTFKSNNGEVIKDCIRYTEGYGIDVGQEYVVHYRKDEPRSYAIYLDSLLN